MQLAHSACHVLAKPTGSVCNLDCQYCFYLEKEKLYPERKQNWKMTEETLELFIKQQIEAQDSPTVDLAWQGGEPTLMGINFYKKAVEFAKKYKNGKQVYFAFQTNGILINDEWCRFFKEHNFLIGVSIDGPKDLHDYYRVNRSGKGSFERVMKGIQCLKKHKIPFNTLTVVNNKNVQEPMRVYAFLKSIGSTFLQFIPLVEQQTTKNNVDDLSLIYPNQKLHGKLTSWSVPSLEFGQFLTTIFNYWVRHDVGHIFVQMFDSTLANRCEALGSVCTFQETCGHALAMEANGDLYTCDHYVYPEFKLGNIYHMSIRDMNMSSKANDFGQDKRDKLTVECQQCDFRALCNGGCPKQRFSRSRSGELGHNYLCDGYRYFFSHTFVYFSKMRDMLMIGRSPMEIMPMLQQQNAADQITSSKFVGRNDFCVCGSGKKFKKCCG